MREIAGYRRAASGAALVIIGRLSVLAGVTMSLAGCQGGVLDPQGPIGAAEKTVLLNALAIMLAIVIPTIIATLGIAWWFRASNTKATYRPDWAFSGEIELVVWSIPLLVIIFLGGIAWIGSHDLDPYKPQGSKPLEVQVVSLDWKWLFIYPDEGMASVNQLVVEAGVPIHFSLTSASVMNAFFIPQLGSLIYTMNGMTTQLNLQADHEGIYRGMSAHFSGDGFPGMHFEVRAVSADAFDTWVKGVRNGNDPALDTDTYAALAKQSSNVAPATFSAADPGFFDLIATQHVPPGPGPELGSPSQTVSPRAGG